MRRVALLSFLIVLALGVDSGAEQLKAGITAPADKASVPLRPIVVGTVSNPKAKVWIVVHPLDVSDFWVQPPVTVRANGAWKVQIHIGRPGAIDVGKKFELRAVANPRGRLREGMILSDWPEAGAISDVIEVTRK